MRAIAIIAVLAFAVSSVDCTFNQRAALTGTLATTAAVAAYQASEDEPDPWSRLASVSLAALVVVALWLLLEVSIDEAENPPPEPDDDLSGYESNGTSGASTGGAGTSGDDANECESPAGTRCNSIHYCCGRDCDGYWPPGCP